MVALDDPSTWPLRDTLPLSRTDPSSLWPELGVLIPNRGPCVFLANAYEPGLWKKLGTCERIEYPTFEAMSAAGWVVN